MNKKRKFVPEISVQDAMEQAARLVESMAFEEKVEMTGGVDYFFIRPLERLGIPRVLMSDATMGINLRSEFMGVKYTNHVDKTTAFPATICLAAGWNTDLSYEYAAAVAEQCRAEGIGILLGPGLNLYRHSQCGRNFEYFGEDPYLISKMVESYVAGVQETGVVATIKHFIANNTDYFRRKSNSIVDDRTLHEIYLPGFAAGVEAGAMAVMTGYNLFNGEWCGESSYVIKTLLREELGFQWLVMTDWWSVENGERLIKSGMDIEMPYTIAAKNIQELVDTGTVQVEEIDRMVTHIVATCLAMKLYERKPEPGKYMDRYGLHEKTALRCAREGVVLLKNRDGILPLDADSGDTVL
ncbi:MAG: glycoside hydrolase family 3 protein, partial [Spirochaetota bacterium]